MVDSGDNTGKRAFTLMELLVVIAIIALLMAVLLPSLNRAREQGKRAVCLSNLKQLMLAWTMYADENGDKIVCGDSEEYGEADTQTFLYSEGEIHYHEWPWVRADWWTSDMETKRKAIMDGALYPYVRDVKLYKCPTGFRDELRLYTIVDAMNCIALELSGKGAYLLKNRLEISNPSERFVFLDDGGTGGRTLGGWTNYVRRDYWFDPPPVRHGKGTTFSFADSHGEYARWKDDRTVAFSLSGRRGGMDEQPNNPDIVFAQWGSWGSPPARALGYEESR